MELIDKYVYAVTKRLPSKQREDIEKEIRSLIEDMLSERCNGNPPQNSDVESVLKELGDPSKFAAKYRDNKGYLIGPEYFETYMFVLKIVMISVAFGTGLGKIIELFLNVQTNVAMGIAEIVTAIISGAAQGFTWVTVIFAINERYSVKKIMEHIKDDWKPSDLPKIPKKNELIKPIEPILGIIFAVLFIVLFNFANELMGVYNFENGNFSSVIPIFSDQGLKAFMPLIVALYCITILKECIKLIIGKWNLTLGITVAVINMILLAFCIYIFTNPTVWNSNFLSELYAHNLAPTDPNINIEKIWYGVTHGFIYILAFGFIIESIVSLIKGIKYNK